MVLMVDSESYEKYKKDSSVPIAEVVDSFDVLKYDQGKSGHLDRPSQAEIKDTFGTTNENEIVEFMLKNGQLHGEGMMNKSNLGGKPGVPS